MTLPEICLRCCEETEYCTCDRPGWAVAFFLLTVALMLVAYDIFELGGI